jgi:hypothetical protein
MGPGNLLFFSSILPGKFLVTSTVTYEGPENLQTRFRHNLALGPLPKCRARKRCTLCYTVVPPGRKSAFRA